MGSIVWFSKYKYSLEKKNKMFVIYNKNNTNNSIEITIIQNLNVYST